MTLIGFPTRLEVVARLKPLRPKGRRKLNAPLAVPPAGGNPQLVASAFDYLLRFELQRRDPAAVAGPWVAEHAPAVLRREVDGSLVFLDLFHDDPAAAHLTPDEVFRRVRRVLADARSAVDSYVRAPAPTPARRAGVAGHALRLAKLDSLLRVRKFGRNFEAAGPGDAADLLALLDAVPYGEFVGRRPLLLNPAFGASSRAVGGADADIVAGDMIVDVKTLKAAEVQTSHLDQLLHYLLLARREQAADPAAFPAIARAGLYFSRHAHLWAVDAAEWTDHPDFPALEDWYFRHAAEVYGAAPNAPSG